MRYGWVVFGLTGLALCGPAGAHELKVLVSRPTVESAPARATVYLSWGHRLPVDDLVPAASLERYEVLSPDGKSIALTSEGSSLQANSVELEADGVYRAVATRKPGTYTFVIDEDGERQMRRGPKSSAAGEKIDSSFHSRQTATALVLVGKPGTEPLRPVGLAVEIVPLDAPADWSRGGPLRFRVLVDGKAAAGAELNARTFGPEAEQTAKTDADGVATLRFDGPGVRVLSARVQTPAAETLRDQYDTESYTATLSFEIPRAE